MEMGMGSPNMMGGAPMRMEPMMQVSPTPVSSRIPHRATDCTPYQAHSYPAVPANLTPLQATAAFFLARNACASLCPQPAACHMSYPAVARCSVVMRLGWGWSKRVGPLECTIVEGTKSSVFFCNG